MKLAISAQHINKLGNSLQEYVKSRSHEVIGKYLEDVANVNIHFTKEKINNLCSILITRATTKQTLRSEDGCNDIYSAFDRALAKLEKQLRKYKSKLKNHHKIKENSLQMQGTKYIISPYGADESDEIEEENLSSENPLIIAEKPVEIEHLSVSEAVMKMDLEHLPALMFINSKTDRVNIVYYRRDGNISWVDSHL